MPRLPTMRVIGSHAISTTLVPGSPEPLPPPRRSVMVMPMPPRSSPSIVLRRGPCFRRYASPRRLVTRAQLTAGRPPLRFLLDRLGCDGTQLADQWPVDHPGETGRDQAAGWLVHERHELGGEAGHRARDADAAHVGTATDAVDPSALGHVALHDRAPAPQLDETLR